MIRASEMAVAEARGWIGTPYVHQASVKGAGCDCLGLVRGVWRALYGSEPEAVPGYTSDWSECEGREVLAEAAGRHLLVCSPMAREASGQVLLFRMRDRGVAKHLGISVQTGGSASFVHSFSGYGVVESPLSAPWRRRIVARFEFPEQVG